MVSSCYLIKVNMFWFYYNLYVFLYIYFRYFLTSSIFPSFSHMHPLLGSTCSRGQPKVQHSFHFETKNECIVKIWVWVWYEHNKTIFLSLSFKTFAYDHCFWSMDESETEKFAGQFLQTFLEEATLCISWFSTKHLICIILLWWFLCWCCWR